MDYKVITSDFVKIFITTSKNEENLIEKRFPKNMTISELKGKMELITGGSSGTMKIQVFNKEKYVCDMSDDSSLLGKYPVEDGMRFHVVDTFQVQSDFEFGKVEKFTLADEEYNKKTDSVRAYLTRNKLGQYSDDFHKQKEKQKVEEQKLADLVSIGSRCLVKVSNAPDRRGTVMYNGAVSSLPGLWIGVKYDEPLGKNNGSYNGVKYFECSQNYGAFVKPQNIECGDFPEDDYDLNEEI